MVKLIESARGGVTTEFRYTRNNFTGCREAGCPFLSACMSNPYHVRCPFGAEEAVSVDRIGENTVLNRVFDKIADDIAGVSNSLDLEATYVAVGTSSAATSPTQEDLHAEIYRDTFVDRVRGVTGKVTFYWFFGPSVANGALAEWGFVSDGPSGTLGTGKLINRFLSSITKTSDDTISGQYSITFGNG